MFSLSLLGGKSKRVKDYLILTLLEEFPLRTKLIHNHLRKKYAISVTYQAVHKVITQLMDEQIIIKSPEGYSLNPSWVNRVKLFIEIFNANYAEAGNSFLHELHKIKRDGDVKIITVNTLFESTKAQLVLRNQFREKFEHLPIEKRPIRVNHLYHHLSFLLNPLDAHEGYFEEKHRFNIYHLIESKSNIDQEIIRMIYNYPGPKKHDRFKTGILLPRKCQLMVYDDVVLEIHLSSELRKRMDSFFEQATSIKNFNTLGFFKEVLTAPFKIKLVIYKDRELANSIIEETLEIFKGK